MRINPECLVTFNAVAEFGSVSRAAEYLNLSQPTVRRQLRALTAAMGGPLYTRHARGTSPTGADLLPHAQTMARTMTRVMQLANHGRAVGLTVPSVVPASSWVPHAFLARIMHVSPSGVALHRG